MKEKRKNIVVSILVFSYLMIMGVWLFIRTPDMYSDSERRRLATKPKFTCQMVVEGTYSKEFESFSLDQFPLRDAFRTVKAAVERYGFGKKVIHGLYRQEQYIAKMDYPLKNEMLDHAVGHFHSLYTQYLEPNGIKPYLAIVPDKNYYLAKKAGVLSLDYDKLFERVKNKANFMDFIDIRGQLSIEDYYKTDTHWKQECITGVAKSIGATLGVKVETEYEEKTLAQPFQGVYTGQFALPVASDTIKYMTNATLDACKVTVMDAGGEITTGIYNMDKASGKDPYEMFLSGAAPFVFIENPNATSEKELIIFRDSFGSSLAPLLVEGYQKVTLIDTRYIHSSMLGSYVEFDKQDVLFLYSTLILNNSMVFK